MGKKLNLYYEQLKNLMSGQPPKTLDEAVEALKAQRPAAAPEGEDERKRYDYAMKCDDQIMGRAAEKLKKEAAWDEAAKQISHYAQNPGLTIPKGTGDWMVSMMKTGGTSQDHAYNEMLAARMAFCTGQIGFTSALSTYQSIYFSYDSTVTYGGAENDLRANLRNAPKKILEELDKKIAQGQQQLEELDGRADAILGGGADDEALNKAFEVIESDDIDLLLNAKGALDDLRGFEKTLAPKYPGKLSAAELDERENKWPIPDRAQIDAARDRAEQAAQIEENGKELDNENFINNGQEQKFGDDDDVPFAPEDGEELGSEDSVINNGRERKSGNQEPQPAPAKLDAAQKRVMENQRLNEFLKPYGLTWEERDQKNTGANRAVYRKEKIGRTVILKVTGVDTPDGYKVEISDADPGRLVNFDLAQRIGDVKSKVKLLETREKHTAEYNKVVETWAALMGAKLDDEPSLDQVKDIGNRFHLFGQALEKYIKKRGNNPEPDQKQSWYRQTIKELRSLVSDKLDAIGMVDNHIRTKTALGLDGKEIEEAIGAAQAKGLRRTRGLGTPDLYIETAMKWSKYFKKRVDGWEDEQIRAENLRAELRKQGRNTQVQTEGISVFFQTRELSQNVNLATDKFELKAMLGEELWNMGCNQEVGPVELADTLAKTALACEVAKELMQMETQMVKKGNPPITELVNGGRLYDVVDMVKKSESFSEHYRPLDLSDDPEGQKRNIMEGKFVVDGEVENVPKPAQVAKEIMKSYLERQRQAQAAKGAQDQPQQQALNGPDKAMQIAPNVPAAAPKPLVLQ